MYIWYINKQDGLESQACSIQADLELNNMQLLQSFINTYVASLDERLRIDRKWKFTQITVLPSSYNGKMNDPQEIMKYLVIKERKGNSCEPLS